MTDRSKIERFLEPVYINEKMVLNCAAYLFEGVPVEAEKSESTGRGSGFGAKMGIPLIGHLLGSPTVEASRESGSASIDRSSRRYTVGGLHMAVVDSLQTRNMIEPTSTSFVEPNPGLAEAYVRFDGVLRPSDYYSLIGTMQILGPLLAQVMHDYGMSFLPKLHASLADQGAIDAAVDKYEQSVLSLLEKLERDYLTSKQLEMILWTDREGGRPVGVVDLDVTDHDPAELRAKLSGGRYQVIGKVVRRAEQGKSLDLMEKTIFANVLRLAQSIVEAQGDAKLVKEYQEKIAPVREKIQRFVRLEIPGPAVRIAAMSVCI